MPTTWTSFFRSEAEEMNRFAGIVVAATVWSSAGTAKQLPLIGHAVSALNTTLTECAIGSLSNSMDIFGNADDHKVDLLGEQGHGDALISGLATNTAFCAINSSKWPFFDTTTGQ